MSNGNGKGYNSPMWRWLIAITLIVVVASATLFVLIPGIRTYLSTTTAIGPTSNPGCVFTPGTSNINTPPAGCGIQSQLLSITPMLWNPGLGASTGKFEATTGLLCKIFQLQGGSWQPTGDLDQSSSSGVCITTSAYPVGAQIQVQVCEDDSTNCVQGDYLNTQTDVYCALPSIVSQGLCGSGPGSGYVPFSSTTQSSTAPTSYFYMPIVPLAGDDPNGMNSGTSVATTWTWSNSTQIAASNAANGQCWLGTQTASKRCDAPSATSLGNFYATITTGPVGTVPASPQSFGYASFTPVDPSLQTGSSARGTLNWVLTLEIKATTNNDMCTIQSTTLPGSLAGPFSRGGSSTDQMYYIIIPDGAITRSTDASGNILTSGQVSGTINFNCNQVYNGSGDIVAICATQWAYFSTKYFGASNYNTVNPEAVKVGNAGASPTVNSADNRGLTCSASAYTTLINT